MLMKTSSALSISIITSAFSCFTTNAYAERPNILFIYMDDMGYSDLSCYGETRWETTHIDQLANEGIRFTDAYSASPISSPSRAGLLTGRYPCRMGIQGVYFPDSYTGIPANELLISELLKENGYTTGIIGKWHLGNRDRFLPLQNGFDEYFGIPYSNDMTQQVYLRGNDVEEFHINQHYTIRKYTQEAIDFINRHQQEPFFLYLAHNMMHVPIFCSPEFEGRSGAGIYGDAILEIDWSIGEVINALKNNNLLDNTLIIFASDNGPWLQEGPLGGQAYPLREGKTTAFEGGVRIPTIAYWKGKINPRVENRLICTLDWFPTIAHLCNAQIPDSIQLDGYDITDMLIYNKDRASNVYAYFRNNNKVTGLRVGNWKISLPENKIQGNFWRASTAAHDTLLFNLKDDPSEKVNLFKSNRQMAKKMAEALENYKSNFGAIPPAQVMTGNNQVRELNMMRKKVKEEAISKGIENKGKQEDGFIN